MSHCLPFEAVVAIHAELAPEHMLTDPDSLRGSLGRPMQGVADREFFPSVVEKAAALLHALATTQPFSDGNKRTAWTCCVTYLKQNGIEVSAEVGQDTVVTFVVDIATNRYEPAEIALQLLEWIE